MLNRGTTTEKYNIAFSPIAFLFFSGGYIFVFLGFFFYGILLKSIHNLPQLGFTGFIFFILIGSSIFQFKTNIPASLVTFFRFIIFLAIRVKISILNNSAYKNGYAPNCKIGLSHPIKIPSQINPNIYINETTKTNFEKIIKKLVLKFRYPAK